MSGPWAPSQAPSPTSGLLASGLVTIFDGSTFCVSQLNGDITGQHTEGWFIRDTRSISQWLLRIDGLELSPVTVHQPDPFTATFLSRLPDLHVPGSASTLLVSRHRFLGDQQGEQLTFWNNTSASITCTVTLSVGADLADVFEVKNGRVGPRAVRSGRAKGSELLITRRRGSSLRGIAIHPSTGARIAPGMITWAASVPAHGRWSANIRVTTSPQDARERSTGPAPDWGMLHRPQSHLLSRAPTITTASRNLAETLRRSVVDLDALRIDDPEHPGVTTVAAGAPWFMAMFGRDALLTSWMALPWTTSFALGTLQTLSRYQGTTTEQHSEQQPGRIPHEVRFGPAEPLGRGRPTVYYGSSDATPLFVALLGEVARWSGVEAVQNLLPAADRALAWIRDFGDRDGDGFVEGVRMTGRGLVNQGWKDSPGAICFSSGMPAQPPIALAEVQGYTYAAYRARADLAMATGDAVRERLWSERASALKAMFNERFWLPEQGWFAVGLDHDKQPIDALTSNIGHCLWTGIVDGDKAARVAAALLSDRMFTGWGIRTLAPSMQAYNPMSYHTGSVWPHDSAICAAGLMRYGFADEARRVAEGVTDASEHFAHRLPELFCGYSRSDFSQPVPYPAACSPQAWASGAPLLLLRTMTRFDPDILTGELRCAPRLPPSWLPLHISGVAVDHTMIGLEATASDWRLDGAEACGLSVTHPSPVTG